MSYIMYVSAFGCVNPILLLFYYRTDMLLVQVFFNITGHALFIMKCTFMNSTLIYNSHIAGSIYSSLKNKQRYEDAFEGRILIKANGNAKQFFTSPFGVL